MKARPPASFPGFDGIRLLAAWAVVYSHSYLIAGGPSAVDPLSRLLGETFSFGGYAVKVFFIMSGFLLSASLDANSDPLRFLTNRIFRIVPGFCFASIVTALLIAPLLCKLDLWGVITSKGIWRSIFWSISDLGDYIDIEHPTSRYAELAGYLNGSLWTIPYEVVSYLVLLTLYMILRSDSRAAIAALSLLVLTMIGPRLGLTTVYWDAGNTAAFKLPIAFFEGTLPYFCGGILFYACQKRWGVPMPLLLAALACLLGTALFGLHDVALATAGPVVVAWIGTHRSVLSRLTDRVGDLSYGVYLFGWPVGLLVASVAASAAPWVVFVLSIPLVFVLAYLMHRLVEVPVSSAVKPLVFRWLPRFANCAPDLPVRQRAAHAVAYVFCLAIIVRLVIYPYRFGSNWYDMQWVQLAGVCFAMAVILKLGERMSRQPVVQRLKRRRICGQRLV